MDEVGSNSAGRVLHTVVPADVYLRLRRYVVDRDITMHQAVVRLIANGIGAPEYGEYVGRETDLVPARRRR